MIRRLKYLKMLISVLNRTDRSFLFTLYGQSVCLIIIPFLQIYFTNKGICFFETQGEYKEFAVTLIVLLIVYVLINILNTHLESLNEVKANLIAEKLYSEILSTCLSIDYEELQKKQIQEKKELALKAFDNAALANLSRSFKAIISSSVIIIGITGFTVFTNIYLLCAVIVVIVINSFFVFKVKQKQYNADQEIVPLSRKLDYYREIGSDFSVAKEVRVYNCKKAFLANYQKLYVDMVKVVNNVVSTRKNAVQVANVGNGCIEIAMYLILGYQVLVGHSMTISIFSALALAVRTFHSNMTLLIEAYADIDRNAMHLKDYFEFICIRPTFCEEGKRPYADHYEIRFENVSFRYPNSDHYALKNINIKIHNKEKLSIVGENGSGKTTFVKLLMRLYTPTEGDIFLNDVNIKEIAYYEYLDLFSTVFQDYKIYAFSIRENINMFHEKDDEKIMQIIKKLGLNVKIDDMENKLDTYITTVFDEKGIELSGGQNQKIAIARAVVKDAPIYILDEPTAALDPRAEQEIFEDFNSIIQGRTTVYISHRLSSCLFSDHIAVFEKGSMVEYGNHKELIEKEGLYAELFRMQAKYYVE